MQRQRIILIIGVILGIMAVVMAKMYLDQQKQIIKKDVEGKAEQFLKNQTAVLVAKKDIPKGAAITPEMFATAIIPNDSVQPQAVTSADRIAGMITVAPISEGEQIMLSKLTHSRAAGGLASVTPVGKRAITISVDNISSLGGMLKAGDYVDVFSLLPVPVQTPDGKQSAQMAVIPLIQNVLVLAVGQETSGVPQTEGRYEQQEKREISPLITLSVSPQEASLLAFVQEQGKIRLILRSPADSQIEPIQPASWETVLQQLIQTPQQEPQPKDKEPTTSSFVEIYRGLNKERVPLEQ